MNAHFVAFWFLCLRLGNESFAVSPSTSMPRFVCWGWLISYYQIKIFTQCVYFGQYLQIWLSFLLLLSFLGSDGCDSPLESVWFQKEINYRDVPPVTTFWQFQGKTDKNFLAAPLPSALMMKFNILLNAIYSRQIIKSLTVRAFSHGHISALLSHKAVSVLYKASHYEHTPPHKEQTGSVALHK